MSGFSECHPFFESATDLLLVASLAGEVLQANAAFRSALGYTRPQISSISLEEVFLNPPWKDIASGPLTDACCFQLQTQQGKRIELLGQAVADEVEPKRICVLMRPLDEYQRLEELLELAEREHGLIAGEIHDGFVQHAVGAGMWLESLKEELQPDQAAAREALNTVAECVQAAVEQARQVIGRLRPIVTEHSDFNAGVASVVAEFRRQTAGTIHVVGDVPQLTGPLATAAVRILQESIRNAVKHSQAESITIRLEQQPDRLKLTVEDDGIGFDPDNTLTGGVGLAGIRQRAEVFSGTATIESRPGAGTKVNVSLPTSLTASPPRLPDGEGQD